MMSNDTLWIVGGGVVIVALCFVVCHGGGSHVTPVPVTSGTSTSSTSSSTGTGSVR
jgi:hypothetical protein